ncbi:MAG: hypothetical protein ACK4UN_20770, partial [Limisphaerales bacterium]
MKTQLVTLALALSLGPGIFAREQPANPDLKQLSRIAVSEDERAAAKAVRELRARGEEGLKALLEEHSAGIQQDIPGATMEPQAWQRLRNALDQVAQQKDCHASQLFWFTDFEEAMSHSAKSGKPILSLRLLGELDEEYSCANSRFFRTTLYSNPKVSQYLKQNFVLHWKSVRPVPRVTIDFGDGRTIQRTVTGNSIHYILAADGTPIDALPGLYSARLFLEELEAAQQAAQKFQVLSKRDRGEFLKAYHQDRLTLLQTAFERDSNRLSAQPADLPRANLPNGNVNAPDARRAAAMAYSKSGVERSLLQATLTEVSMPSGSLEVQMNDPIWS